MSDARVKLCGDVLLHAVEGRWIASNPRTHSHVELSDEAMAAIARLASGAAAGQWTGDLAHVEGWDRTGLELGHGLWSDPTRLVPRVGEARSGTALLDLLRRRWILCAEDASDYETFLAPHASLLDHDHLGTFHQIVGQHLILTLRTRKKWKWWHETKFAADGKTLRPGPYKWVQEPFFDSYFARQPVAGERILDFACGNGYYARKFAAAGARVIGVDTEAELIDLARSNDDGRCEFVCPESPEAGLAFLNGLPANSFDRVYMSDILLLLLEPSSDASAAEAVMSALSRLLRPHGKLHLFEPNPVFWLGSRIADPRRPMVVVPEYRNQLYNVAPTLDRVMDVMGRCDLRMAEFIHPPGDGIPAEQKSLKQFASCFPLWDFITFERVS